MIDSQSGEEEKPETKRTKNVKNLVQEVIVFNLNLEPDGTSLGEG